MLGIGVVEMGNGDNGGAGMGESGAICCCTLSTTVLFSFLQK
jgi:hypothetical protein